MILQKIVSKFPSTIQHYSYLRNRYCFYTTIMSTSLLVPPVSVRGMTCLDRDAFTIVVNIPTLKLRDSVISKNIHILKKYLLKICNFKPVQKINDKTMIYLNPNIVTKFEDITENDRKLLADQYESFSTMNITMNYNNWRRDEILNAILPKDILAPTSYSLVGHIVQLNLRDMHLPYKAVIGQVFLDKIANARTVINKVNTIDTTFRYFTMEILAGEKNMITTVKENGYTYQFNFAQVYWNSRLSTEHMHMITLMKQDDALYDVFAGVGPFSIPAARKNIKVFANDLNPESYKWLQKNAAINKIGSNFEAFNMDGREFLRNIVKKNILWRRDHNLSGTEHIVMNLPALAIEFLDVLSNWFTQEELEKVCVRPPIFHVYCFVKACKNADVCKLGKLQVEEKLNYSLSADSIIDISNIRDVSPNKEMKTMGKNHTAFRKTNVFKVTKRSANKMKAKTKKVMSNLKKLDSKENKDKIKEQTMTINQLMDKLYEDIRSQPNKKSNETQKKPEKSKIPSIPKVVPAQMDSATSMVKKMELN